MLTRLREAWHPLHLLRSSSAFTEHVSPRLDFTVRTRLAEIEWPIYVRLMRNFSYVVGRRLLEPGPTALMDVLLTRFRPRVFWDVGANVGFYSWFFLSRVAGGRALLLEPEPENLVLLEKTIRRAGLAGATCLPIAASDAVGQSVFRRDPVSGATGGLAGSGEAFITRHYGLEPPTISVPTTTLDELMRGSLPPGLLKVDVEGGELAVFRGAENLIREHGPPILFELTRDRSEVLEFLTEHGYHVHPSSGPDVSMAEGADFVAIPNSLEGSWEDMRYHWRQLLGKTG